MRYSSLFLFITLFLSVLPFLSIAQDNDLDLSGQFFFSYEKFLDEREVDNKFTFKRGYITFEKTLGNIVDFRFTQDISVDQQGDGRGNIELRVKYAYVNIHLKDLGVIHEPALSAGVVKRPWVDFVQNINVYRSQGSMFLDHHNILASADYGLSFTGNLGSDLPEHLQKGLSSGYGRFGSFSFGVYNGGGYSAIEENNNKILEGRISLRPLAERLAGLQLSFNGAWGNGNNTQNTEFKLVASALSFESEKLSFIVQGFLSEGDGAGEFIQSDFEAMHLMGWSAFSEIKPFSLPLSLTLRYDELYDQENQEWINKKAIAGLAYIFKNRSKIILDVDRQWMNTLFNSTSFYSVELITEIRF